MLTMKTRKKFGLKQDPFADDVSKAEDVYLTDDARFAVEYFTQAAKSGGMLALVGESGSGKTTLRRYALDRMAAAGGKTRAIIPQCVDRTRLTAGAICDAIIADCSAERPRRSLEAKARQVRDTLANSSRAGYGHVLIIEEAHDLSIQTLKYLKRFWEMEDGYKRLLAIALVGQPELKHKLDESKNFEAREVIRRMEVLEIEPLDGDGEVAAYLDLKFARVGKDRRSAITDEGCAELAARLRHQPRVGAARSVAFPLLINNWAKKALNLAAKLGAPAADAEIVKAL